MLLDAGEGYAALRPEMKWKTNEMSAKMRRMCIRNAVTWKRKKKAAHARIKISARSKNMFSALSRIGAERPTNPT